jgi:ectoine hydroxylase-related dioxygenase (phytanoyl-CoA dioxygenase family)
MQPGISELVEDTAAHWDILQALHLTRNVAELDVLGYTIIPPDVVGDAALMTAAKSRIVALAEAAGAVSKGFTTYQEGLSFELYHLIKQGEVFEQLLVNPAILALGRYLLGNSMILNNSLAYVKGPTDKYLRMHCDTLTVPDPLPDYRHLVNFTLVLSDYTLDGGCIGIVPGSHRYRRHPTAAEAVEYSYMQPIECPAGSLIVIPGNTWHGAFPKKTKDLRVTMVQAYSRIYMAPSVTHDISAEILHRNGPDFARILGRDLWTGYDQRGPDLDKFAKTYRTQRSHLA